MWPVFVYMATKAHYDLAPLPLVYTCPFMCCPLYRHPLSLTPTISTILHYEAPASISQRASGFHQSEFSTCHLCF